MTNKSGFCESAVLLTVLCMTLVSSGCATNRILGADFNAFNVNATDSEFVGDIPGLPDGDSIEGHPFVNGSLSIVVNGPAGGGNNLRIVDVSPPGPHRPALVSFVVADHALPDEYRIVWNGATEESPQHTEVIFLDETGNLALRLTFLDTQALLSGTGGVDPIHVEPMSKHEVLVTINRRDDKVGVRYNSSAGVETRQSTLMDNEFGKLRFIRFANLSPEHAYYLSHVNAVAR